MSLEYVNRRGDRYYILQGKTKTGKPKYYCSKRAGGLPVERLPEGYEIHEDPVYGLVSVRKVRPSRIQPFEREFLVRRAKELAAVSVLIDVDGDSLVIYTSDIDPQRSATILSLLLGDLRVDTRAQSEWLVKHGQYSPMLRFTLTDEDNRLYSVERWCYRGSVDDWIPLKVNTLLEHCASLYLKHLDHESFFELM